MSIEKREKEKKLGLDGLVKVWEKVFSLMKMVTGDVDVINKGTLQSQIDNLDSKKTDKTGDLSSAKVTYTEAGSLTPLASGEKVSTAFGKIAKAVSSLIGHINNKSNPHQVTKSQIGLGNVENKSSTTIRSEITKQNVTTALGYTPLNAALKGAKSGVAELDATGRVPSAQLPSFVDDVMEGYMSGGKFYKEAAHTTLINGETGKIYIDLPTNKTYRWSGTSFAEISASLALGETSSSAYRGDRGKIAYDHSQLKNANPHGVTKAHVGLGNVDNTSDANKPVSTQQQAALDKKLDKTGDAQSNIVSFTSGDALTPTGWADVGLIATKETLSSLMRKFSLAVKNVRYLYKMLGTTDISAIGNGTVTGAIGKLNTDMRSLIKTAIADSNPSVTVSANSATKINVPLPQVAGFTPIDCISLRSITNGMTVSGMTINSARTSIEVTAVNLSNESVNFNEITLFVLYTLAF